MLPSSGLTTTILSSARPKIKEVIVQHGGSVQMVDGHVEEALDLGGVQVHRQNSISTRSSDHIGDQFGGNRHAAFVFAVLASIAKVRNGPP